MDTPGILWPKIDDYSVSYNLASLTSIKEEILNKDDIAIYIIKSLYNYYPHLLKEKYKRGENVKDEDGAGLGLYLANYFIDNMNGKMELSNSNPGFMVKLYIRLI